MNEIPTPTVVYSALANATIVKRISLGSRAMNSDTTLHASFNNVSVEDAP